MVSGRQVSGKRPGGKITRGIPRAPLRVAILAACGDALIDVVGPFQIFTQASREGGGAYGKDLGRYAVSVLSCARGSTHSRGGVGLRGTSPALSFKSQIDTLIVAGSDMVRDTKPDRRLVQWVAHSGSHVRRLASVCSGAFLLAEAGLLDGKRVTTHWRYGALLAARYPQLRVDPDPIYIRDGNVYTSAGMTAGMDLALALVEEDFGGDVALSVARSMVLYMHRPGGQSQFSAALRRQAPATSPIGRAQHWVSEHVDEQFPLERLAEVAGMSPRNFARVFVREAGVTPARYVEEMRLEEARRRLERSADPVETVAAASGFGSVDSLQRSFQSAFRITPTEYRGRFATAIRAPRSTR